MSYVNMIMYGAVLPSYKSKKKSEAGKQEQEVIKADDPKNRERVRQFLENIE